MKSPVLLIKPASGSCNMRCGYCFYADEMTQRTVRNYGFMNKETVENLIEKTLTNAEDTCTFAFQGGEPTLIGLDYYKRFVKTVKEKNKGKLRIDYALQTNGIVIDDEWADFFHENNFLVGVSLDGPADVHNMNRTLTDGKPSFSKVMGAINILRKHNVEFNTLTVVTAMTARYTEKIYRFFQKNGLNYQQYIACLDHFGEERGGEKFSLTPEGYGNFLCRLFDLWYADLQSGKQPYIRYFENLVAMAMGRGSELCGTSGVCSNQYVIEADGSVYPCDFYAIDGYLIGNLNENSFDDIDEERKKIGFVEKSLIVAEECKICPWYRLCRGGCRRDRDAGKNLPLELNYYCEAYKKFFVHSHERIAHIARVLMSEM